jgi:hypothetical protein
MADTAHSLIRAAREKAALDPRHAFCYLKNPDDYC